MEEEINFVQKTDEILKSLFDHNKKINEIEKQFFKILFTSRKFGYDEIIVSSVYYFFFPVYNNHAKNTDNEFWFEKNKNDNNHYTEFNYAIDLLVNIKEYFRHKNKSLYYRESIETVNKFYSYRNIDLYMLFTKDKFKEIVSHISAYLTKDINYFKEVLSIDINETDVLEDISTLRKFFLEEIKYESLVRDEDKYNQLTEEIAEIKNKHHQKIEELNCINNKLTEEIAEIKNEHRQKVGNFTKKIEELNNNIDDLKNDKYKSQTEIEKLNNNIEEINKKIDKIYLRDTIKYSIRYIYRMFYSQVANKNFEYNIYEEIKELKIILNKPEYKKTYGFLLNFIENIRFGDLNELNKVSHPSMETRNIDDIKKYLPNINGDLERTVEFIKKLPDIQQ